MSKIQTAVRILKKEGVSKIIKIIRGRVFPPTIDQFKIIKKALSGKSGLEIGGPSWVFKDYSLIPIYRIIKNLDTCNFSSKTIWEGSIKNGDVFNFYKNKKGVQYIGEATDLSFIPDSKYEFIISSHCLEHTANPLKAIKEWLRVIKKDGYIIIVVPNKDYTFDHKRKITEFSHLLDDYQNNRGEDDFTHLEEILKLHDLKKDLKAGTFEQFKERSLNNVEIRALHHHVFDIDLLKNIFSYFEVQTILTYTSEDLVIFGKK